MILVDANLLLYAKLQSFPEHSRAHAWLDAQFNGRSGVGLPWESLLAFARLASNPRVFAQPLPMDAAWRQIEDWIALPNVWIPRPTDGHAQTLAALVHGQGLTSKLVMDAQLAALAIDHRLVLCSADHDFKRFAGLRFENPLC